MMSIDRDRTIGRISRNPDYARREAIVLNYYSREPDPDSPQAFSEARELLEVSIPVAQEYNDSLIVIESTFSVGPRWSTLVKGRAHFFIPVDHQGWQEVIP
jgi:hypothetical protein